MTTRKQMTPMLNMKLPYGEAVDAIRPKNISGQETIWVRLTTGTMPFLNASRA